MAAPCGLAFASAHLLDAAPVGLAFASRSFTDAAPCRLAFASLIYLWLRPIGLHSQSAHLLDGCAYRGPLHRIRSFFLLSSCWLFSLFWSGMRISTSPAESPLGQSASLCDRAPQHGHASRSEFAWHAMRKESTSGTYCRCYQEWLQAIPPKEA